MRKSLPVMNAAIGAHEQRADGPYFIWGAGTPGQRPLDHAPVSLAAGSGQLVLGERGEDNAGADRAPNRGPRPKTRTEQQFCALREDAQDRRRCRDRQHPTGIRTLELLLALGAAHGTDVWPILAAGAGTPQPRPAGDALILVRDSQVFLDYVRQSHVFVDGPAKTRPPSKSRAPRSEAGLTPTCAGSGHPLTIGRFEQARGVG